MTAASRVLICGSRRWPWPDTITTVLDRAAVRHGDDLVVIEGAGTGAERAAHRWCQTHDLRAWRHRCHPAAPAGRRRGLTQHATEAHRNQLMLYDEGPGLVIAFHERFDPEHQGNTADLCLRALATGIPVWLVPTADPDHGLWLDAHHYTGWRADHIARRAQGRPPQATSPTTPALSPDRTEPPPCPTTPSTSPSSAPSPPPS